jgi:hypothetical protein
MVDTIARYTEGGTFHAVTSFLSETRKTTTMAIVARRVKKRARKLVQGSLLQSPVRHGVEGESG